MIAKKRKSDAAVELVRDVLAREYGKSHPRARIDVYRYCSGMIRVRILDPDASKVPIYRRSKPVNQILGKELPENIQQEITFLIILAPKETETSAMNTEFENPTHYDDD